MSSHAARSEACFAVAVYSACSASMLIVNKLAVHHLPAPAFVTLMQFVATALVVPMGSALGLVSVDTSEWSRIKFFIVYTNWWFLLFVKGVRFSFWPGCR